MADGGEQAADEAARPDEREQQADDPPRTVTVSAIGSSTSSPASSVEPIESRPRCNTLVATAFEPRFDPAAAPRGQYQVPIEIPMPIDVLRKL